ncbi:MAG: ATP-dependent helicase RecG [Patescibacteria group bacterium]|nr:ATP-dependent helicase RecG [Patescibacteria group bacterium]
MHLTTPLSQGGAVLKRYTKKFDKLGLNTFSDLLFHLPSRYEDYSIISSIDKLQEGEVVTVRGTIIDAKNSYTRRFKSIQKIILSDGTGELLLLWFNQPYIIKNLKLQTELSIAGRIEKFSGKNAIISPEYELASGEELVNTGRIIPIYPVTQGLSSKMVRKHIFSTLKSMESEIEEYLPNSILKKYAFMDIKSALWHIHYPQSFDETEKARQRLAFDELFTLQLAARERKRLWSETQEGIHFQPFSEKMNAFLKTLPFELTPSQQTAVEDITHDTQGGTVMNRLLQGDVGSGKTIIAACGLYLAYLNGFQGALMAPTEILAQQHFATLSSLLKPLGVKVVLATSSTSKNKIEETFDIAVGTHSLVGKNVTFNKLGLIVIDEQQRFGVEQRGILREKGNRPHLLTMTATPIPRTAALTLYSDLALTYLHDMPKGRKTIKTWLVPEEKRLASYAWIRKEIQENDSQVFIICPFIEESENASTIKAATKEFERLQTEIFSDLSLGLLHGKMRSKEKDTVLDEFKQKKFDILVATPVVEVGIDISNATIILIEGAERFGLSQLHQLRGRVGRGDKQSYCLLFTESSSEITLKRLKAMESMKSGAELSEYDLELRGPGEIYGLKQSGVRLLKIAKFSDRELLDKAKRATEDIGEISTLSPLLQAKIQPYLLQKVSPD